MDLRRTEAAPGLSFRAGPFEGPLDLLFRLIEENRVDILDIPIAEITRQYLETIDRLEKADFELAGDFIVMAATLLLIKARVLVPDPPGSPEEGLPAPSRVTLDFILAEYRKAAGQLAERESVWREIFRREESPSDEELPPGEVSLYDLLNALARLLARAAQTPTLGLSRDDFSVGAKMALILERLEGEETFLFEALFSPTAPRAEVIAIFLAILELLSRRLIRVIQEEAGGRIGSLLRIVRRQAA